VRPLLLAVLLSACGGAPFERGSIEAGDAGEDVDSSALPDDAGWAASYGPDPFWESSLPWGQQNGTCGCACYDACAAAFPEEYPDAGDD